MPKKAFFCFHYERDYSRAAKIVRAWESQGGSTVGFIDGDAWNVLKKKGVKAVEKWVESQIKDVDIGIVLVGRNTANQPWVRYAVQFSYKRHLPMFAVYIHSVKDEFGNVDDHGDLTFGRLDTLDDKGVYFWEIYHAHDWEQEHGEKNMVKWSELACGQMTGT